MKLVHRVEDGECLTTIAARYGFQDPRALHDHPENAALKARRPDPNILHPGDEIVIPDKQEKSVECQTGAVHRFRIKLPRKRLRLRLQDLHGEPMAYAHYTLTLGAEVVEGDADGDGVLEESVPVDATSARIAVGENTWNLRIGALNPIEETSDDGISGVQARLRNLGVDPGPIDGELGPRTREAICVFEALHGLEITGECGEATIRKLREIHGC